MNNFSRNHEKIIIQVAQFIVLIYILYIHLFIYSFFFIK